MPTQKVAHFIMYSNFGFVAPGLLSKKYYKFKNPSWWFKIMKYYEGDMDKIHAFDYKIHTDKIEESMKNLVNFVSNPDKNSIIKIGLTTTTLVILNSMKIPHGPEITSETEPKLFNALIEQFLYSIKKQINYKNININNEFVFVPRCLTGNGVLFYDKEQKLIKETVYFDTKKKYINAK